MATPNWMSEPDFVDTTQDVANATAAVDPDFVDDTIENSENLLLAVPPPPPSRWGVPEGQPKLEMLSVRIDNPVDLYGTIIVRDAWGIQSIYNRKREECESISTGDTLLLTGPMDTAISAFSFVDIIFVIVDKDTDPFPDPIDDGCPIFEAYDHFRARDELYNVPQEYEVDWRYGLATVRFVVFSNAVEANLEVKLVDGDIENPANIYGLVIARNSDFATESVLFQKSLDECIKLKPGEFIPLSRAAVAVQWNTSLIIQVELYHHNSGSPDDEIFNGTLEFPTQTYGTLSQKSIFSKCGEIQVTANWRI